MINKLAKMLTNQPSKGAFVNHVIRHVRGLGWPDPTLDENLFAIRSEGVLYGLEGAFKGYCLAPKGARDAFLTRWFLALADSTVAEEFEDVQTALLPLLRRRDESLQFAAISDFSQVFLERPFSDDLVIGVGIDREQSIVRATREHRSSWGVDEVTVWNAALHNLRLKSADMWTPVGSGVFIGAWGDAYDAARVMFPDLVRRVPIEGELVAMVPDRDTIVVSGRGDSRGLEKMAELALRIYDESERKLSVQPLQLCSSGAWRPIDLQGPVRNAIDERLAIALAQTYTWQEQIVMKNPSEDVFYASLLIQKQSESVTSICVWTRDVATLLPRADIIAFVRTDDERAFVRWDDATAIIGPLQEEPATWPPRFRTQQFPNDEQFGALRDVATM